jgi:hypothetical protein
MKIEIFTVEDRKVGCKLLFDDMYSEYLYKCEDSGSRTLNIITFGDNYELQVSEFNESYDNRFSLTSGAA